MSPKSTFLFAAPSFLDGAAYLFDFQGTYASYNISKTPLEADVKAIYADWLVVGDAIFDATQQFSAEFVGQK